MAGVVVRFVARQWPAGNTAVPGHVMKAPVELAMFVYRHAAIAVRFRKTSCVAIVKKRSTAGSVILQQMVLRQSKSGPDLSNVRTRAVASLIVENMPASNHAIDRTLTPLIVRDLPT